MTPRGRFLHELAVECLDNPNLCGHYGKTITVVGPDGGLKRVPTIRIQVAVWTVFRGETTLARNDQWMVEKITWAIEQWKRQRRASA